MKDLLVWVKSALYAALTGLAALFGMVLAILGMYYVTTLAVDISSERCAHVTEHTSLCLVDRRE